jgi:hypothetical protein
MDSGIVSVIITKHRPIAPPLPIPWIMRPIISSTRLMEPQQIPVPIVATTRAIIHMGPWLKTSLIIVKYSWLPAPKRRYTVLTQNVLASGFANVFARSWVESSQFWYRYRMSLGVLYVTYR